LIVPHFLDYESEDDYTVQFALMKRGDHCEVHTDRGNIYPQRILGLGNFQGAVLRCWHDASMQAYTDMNIRHRVVEFEARVPHEIVMHSNFTGEMYFVIWYRCYDRHKTKAGPLKAHPEYIDL